jgi:sigma 54 modulation/S30EA-like ribosomal protein
MSRNQHVRLPAPSVPRSTSGADILDMRVKGAVDADDRDYAYVVISAVLARHRTTTDHAHVRLDGANGPDGPRLVQVNLTVSGAPARTQVAGSSMLTAISRAAVRLDRQIRRLTIAWEPWPWPDPERRCLAMPGEGNIARLKTFRLHIVTPGQAVAILNAMDYDAHLFTDSETGEDAVVYRAGPTGLCLARQCTKRPPSMPSVLPLTIDPGRPRTLTPAQAAARLAAGQLPFVFYIDDVTRRGTLLYRRYDGDLGLIAPTDPDRPS